MSECQHEESMWGRCTRCGMTWGEQARAREGRMSIHEQARAESENLLPSPALWAEANERALRVLPDKTPEVRNGYVAGFLAGHEAATRTREQHRQDCIDAMDEASQNLHN